MGDNASCLCRPASDLKPGFAFVEYEEPSQCSDAIAKLHDANVLGNRIVVEPAKLNMKKFSSNRQKGYRVKVSDLHVNVSWQDLKDFARTAGEVMFTNVFMDGDRKLGVIEFETREACEEALRKLDGVEFRGHVVRVMMVCLGMNEVGLGIRSELGGWRAE